MTKEKIEKLKKWIKHHAPEIIVATSVVVGIAGVIYTQKQLNKPLGEDDLGGALFMTNGDLDLMKMEDTPIRYPAPDGIYTVSFEPK